MIPMRAKISETLFPLLRRQLHNAQTTPGPHDRVEGLDLVDKVIDITQDPIGRTPRSNPATYVGVFDDIRQELLGFDAGDLDIAVRVAIEDELDLDALGKDVERLAGLGGKLVEEELAAIIPRFETALRELQGLKV